MPYNGAGQFVSLGAPTFPAVADTFILASYFNATMNDIFGGLSNAVTRDGQGGFQANVTFNGFKITNLGNGTNAGDAVNFGQVFNGGSFTNATLLGTTTLSGTVAGAGAASFTVPTITLGDSSQKAVNGAALQAQMQNLPQGALPPLIAGAYLTNNGTTISWGILPGVGGQTVTGNVTLTSASPAAMSVTPVNPGLYATLPDATTVSRSTAPYSIYNNGDFDYGVRDSAGTQLGWVRPRTGALIGLADSSTAAGVWAYYGLEKLGITARYQNAALSASTTVVDRVTIDADRICLLFTTGTSIQAIVFNQATATFGAMTLVRGSLGSAGAFGILSATDQVLVVVGDTGSSTLAALTLTISGTSITVNTAATVTLGGGLTMPDKVVSTVLISVGSSFVFAYATTSVASTEIRAMTVSGTTVTIGAASVLSAISSGNTTYMFASGSVVRTFHQNSTTGIMRPYTVSGTTLTAGTQATITVTDTTQCAVAVNANGNIVLAYTNTNGVASIFRLTGTTEAVSTVTVSANAPSLQFAATTIGATNKVLVCYVTGTTCIANIVTDTNGTASVGTAITNVFASGPAASFMQIVGVSGNNVRVFGARAGGSDPTRALTVLDCSGASPAISRQYSVPVGQSISVGAPTWQKNGRPYTTVFAGEVAFALGNTVSSYNVLLSREGLRVVPSGTNYFAEGGNVTSFGPNNELWASSYTAGPTYSYFILFRTEAAA